MTGPRKIVFIPHMQMLHLLNVHGKSGKVKSQCKKKKPFCIIFFYAYKLIIIF